MPEPASRPHPALRAAIVVLPILVGLALFLASRWWAKPVAEAIQSLPGGKWLTVPLPFVPLLPVLLGVAAWKRAGQDPRDKRQLLDALHQW